MMKFSNNYPFLRKLDTSEAVDTLETGTEAISDVPYGDSKYLFGPEIDLDGTALRKDEHPVSQRLNGDDKIDFEVSLPDREVYFIGVSKNKAQEVLNKGYKAYKEGKLTEGRYVTERGKLLKETIDEKKLHDGLDKLRKEFEELAGLSLPDLVKKLNNLNAEIKAEKVTKKDSEIWKKHVIDHILIELHEANVVVGVDASTNRYILEHVGLKTGLDLKILNKGISQPDLQIIALLRSTVKGDFQGGNIFEKNIPHNIFKSVAGKFKLKNSDGKHWLPNHFKYDSTKIVPDSSIDTNRADFSTQAETEIAKLKTENKDPKTKDHIRAENAAWIQKLEIAKSFSQDPRNIDTKATDFAREFVVSPGGIGMSYMSTIGANIESISSTLGSNREALMRQVPTLVVALLLSWVASKLLGKGALRAAGLTFIWTIAGLGIADDLNKQGALKRLQKALGIDTDSNGISETHAGSSDLSDAVKTKLSGFWDSAPAGTREEHKGKYAKMAHDRVASDGREYLSSSKLDTLFVASSHDLSFLGKNKSELTGVDATTVFSLFTPNTRKTLKARGISGADALTFINLLATRDQETGDTRVSDLFEDNRDVSVNIKMHQEYIQGEDGFNEDVYLAVNTLPGLPLDALDALDAKKKDSTKALVQDAINISTKDGMLELLDQATPKKMEGTIAELKVIMTNTSDKNVQATIQFIIDQYTSTKNTIEDNKQADEYLIEAVLDGDLVPGETFVKDIINSSADGANLLIAGIMGTTVHQYIGDIDQPSLAKLDTLIAEAKQAKTNISGRVDDFTATERKDKIDNINTAISRLRQQKIDGHKKLAEQEGDKDKYNSEIQIELTAQINADPEKFADRIDALEPEMSKLKKIYTSYDDYGDALTTNLNNIAQLKLIVAIGSSALVDQKARTAFAQASDMLQGLKAFETNLIGKAAADKKLLVPLTNHINTATTLTQLENFKKQFKKFEESIVTNNVATETRTWLDDNVLTHLGYHSGLKASTNNIAELQKIYNKTQGSSTAFDTLQSELDTAEQALETKQTEIIGNIAAISATGVDVTKDVSVNKFITQTAKLQTQLKRFSGAVVEQKEREIKQEINKLEKKFSDALTDKLAENAALADRWERVADGLSDESGNKFEAQYKVKLQEAANKELEAKLSVLVSSDNFTKNLVDVYLKDQEAIDIVNGGFPGLASIDTLSVKDTLDIIDLIKENGTYPKITKLEIEINAYYIDSLSSTITGYLRYGAEVVLKKGEEIYAEFK